MLRTVIVRNELIKETLKKGIRLNLVRSLSFECTKRRNRLNQPSLLVSKQKAPWQYNIIRFYADLPKHTKVPLPALSPTMESGNIMSWAKKEGDKLNEGDLLCEIETDKATMGFETPEEGYLAKIVIPAGTKNVKIGQLVCIIVENQADVAAFKDFKADATAAAPTPKPAAAAPAPAAPKPAAAAASPPPPKPAETSGTPGEGRVYASPLARKMAREKGVELSGKGTGVYESITSKDFAGMKAGRESAMAKGLAKAHDRRGQVAGAAPAAPSAPRAAGGAPKSMGQKYGPSTYTDIPITNIRSVIAKRLVESKTTIPHYFEFQNCNVTNLLALRKKWNAKLEKQKVKLSINDFIMKATACASMRFPEVNASWAGKAIRQFDDVDISLAVSTPSGLITPIVFSANKKGIITISKECKELAKRARENKLLPHEFQGGTISVSNVGMFGVSYLCPIINPPQAAIVGIGCNETRVIPDPDSDNGFKAAQFITVTLSADHRVIDGALAAQWLNAFREFLEYPETMIL